MSDQALRRRQAADRLLMHARTLTEPRWTPLPHQIPPPGDWYGWLLLAGRGAGKTDACARYVHDHVYGPPCLPGPVPHWIGIIAPTLGDAATSCFSGPSGLSAHSPEAKMVNTTGGTVIRWPNGSVAKLFGANTEPDTERLRSGGNRCAAEGTLVRTADGERPIETIRTGDWVWTRNGLRRVLKVWDNGIKEVRRYDHAAGSTWLTPDHKVATDQGWTEASLVPSTGTVFTWPTTSSTTGCAGTRASGTRTTATAAVGSCIGGCTRKKSGPSRMGCTCTTRTTTSGTTEPTTLCCCALESTGTSTGPSVARTGTARAAGRPGSGPNTGTSSVAVAVRASSREAPQEPGTAPVAGRLRRLHGHGKHGCAACAETGLSASVGLQPVPVHGGALRSSHTSRVTRVYDLTVEHDHEFFADGLLISNCLAWLEEMAAWRYLDDAWAQMRFGLRSGPRPHWVASTTPKPRPLIKKLASGGFRNVELSRASMYDNPHLQAELRQALEEEYGNTDLGRQELHAEILDEDSNALWTRAHLNASRTEFDLVPKLARVSIGVDPSGGAGEQGIVAVGKAMIEKVYEDTGRKASLAHGYVLGDRTVHLKPEGWGRRAVEAAVEFEADDICVEVNFGGEMAVSTIRAAADAMGINIPIKIVRATRGKVVRAQPVSALTAQGRWHMVGVHAELEDQLCVVAGTLVDTQRGLVPVEQLRPGDRALTREGLAPIAWAGQTGLADHLMRVQVQHRVLHLTPWHKIYDPQQDQFVPALSVRRGQPLVVRPSSGSTDLQWPGAVDGGTWSRTATTGTPGASSFTELSGRLIEARSLTDTSSITMTRTSGITRSGTLSSRPLRSTSRSTVECEERSLRMPGPGAEDARLSGPSRSLGSGRALSAGTSSGPRPLHLATADDVAPVELSTAVPVYDLMIGEGYLPEFYANGILVHNCTWYPELDWSPDRLDAMVWPGWHNRIVKMTGLGMNTPGGMSSMSKAIG